MPLAPLEGRHLLAVVDEFILLLDGRSDDDEALERLTPTAYPDDPEASAEFRRSTRDDGFDQRLADALEVRTGLERFQGGRDDRSAVLEISTDVLDAWLRTLTGIRLVLASRLGVDRTDVHDPEDVRYGTYDWLGYRLEVLVQLADQHDAR